MSKPLVKINRPDENNDKVLLNFNEDAYRLVRALPLMLEEVKEGILLTVPEVDHHNAIKVSYNKRSNIETDFFEDFENDRWFEITQTGEDRFLIHIN